MLDCFHSMLKGANQWRHQTTNKKHCLMNHAKTNTCITEHLIEQRKALTI